MPEESKRVALFVFLFIVFIFLAVIIFVFSFGTLRGGTNYSEITSKEAIECVGYSFRIVGGSMDYSGNELSFTVEPSGGGKLNHLVIRAGAEEAETKNIDFSASYQQKVKVTIKISDTFEIFPKGCEENIKVCSIITKSCEVK